MNSLISSLAVAPMIDWTYSHYRVFLRYITPHALLYTEMQTTGAIKNNAANALYYRQIEHPLALQLGGYDSEVLAQCALEAERSGFKEINLNLGCPSDKVKAGHFGACLMKEPTVVAQCIRAMRSATSLPVSAKVRIGVDELDSYEFFSDFMHQLVESGVQKVIVHARKAWLNGLSPKQNRTIPKIDYDFVYKIKQELPRIPIVINGDIRKLNEILIHLKQVDGIMLGRLVCDNPYYLSYLDHALYPNSELTLRSTVFRTYWDYLHHQFTLGTSLSLLLKPLYNLVHGVAGTKLWKQMLMELQQTKNLKLVTRLIHFLEQLETCTVAM